MRTLFDIIRASRFLTHQASPCARSVQRVTVSCQPRWTWSCSIDERCRRPRSSNVSASVRTHWTSNHSILQYHLITRRTHIPEVSTALPMPSQISACSYTLKRSSTTISVFLKPVSGPMIHNDPAVRRSLQSLQTTSLRPKFTRTIWIQLSWLAVLWIPTFCALRSSAELWRSWHDNKWLCCYAMQGAVDNLRNMMYNSTEYNNILIYLVLLSSHIS